MPLRKFFPALLLVLIVLLAGFLRIYKLDQNPPSLDWDEASLGWNAYSILKTGTDEYGKAFPVSIRSFNDYKPPMYVYAAIPSIAIFGLNEFSVRLPSAIAGILTVVATYFLVRRFSTVHFSLLTAFLLAISPWSIQFSRGAFEANLALFFFVTGATLLACFLNRRSFFFLFSSFFFFVLSIYSYHSPRLVIPAFLFLVFIAYRQTFFRHWKIFLLSSLLSLLLLYPLVRNTLHVGSLDARFSTVSIFNSPQDVIKDPIKYAGLFANNYLSHFNFDFLFLSGDGNPRHHVPDMGLLYLVEAPFLFAGFYFMARRRPKWAKFILCWLIAAPVASALTTTAPHAIRSLLFLPVFQIVIAYGLVNLLTKKVFVFAAALLYILNFSFYIHEYFVHFPVESAQNWQFGYKEAVKKVLSLENKYDRIYFTSQYDQPYIYFLFYGRIDPIIKNNTYFYKGMDKYDFSLDKRDKKGLYVIAPEDTITGFSAFDHTNFPDGKTAFIFGTINN